MGINDNINFNQSCIDDLFNIEGRILHPFLDKSNIWTIGIGHIIKETDSFSCLINDQVRQMLQQSSEDAYLNCTITEEEALNILITDVSNCVSSIKDNVTSLALNQNQVNALILFLMNVGVKWIQHGIVKEALDAGDYNAVCAAILELYKSDVDGSIVVVDELLYRRQYESALFAKSIEEPIHNPLEGFDDQFKQNYYVSVARLRDRGAALQVVI